MCDNVPESCQKCKSWVTDGCDAWYCEKGFSIGECNNTDKISKNVQMNILKSVVTMACVFGFIIIYGNVREAMDFGLVWENGIMIVIGLYIEYGAFFHYKKRVKEINENS